MFRVGDRVWTIDNGWGTVVEVKGDVIYPVRVEFAKTRISYTKDGRELENKNVMLFFDEITIPETAFVRPKWRADSGEIYKYVDSDGVVESCTESFYGIDNRRFELGNYFKTREEAEKSKFYKVFND